MHIWILGSLVQTWIQDGNHICTTCIRWLFMGLWCPGNSKRAVLDCPGLTGPTQEQEELGPEGLFITHFGLVHQHLEQDCHSCLSCQMVLFISSLIGPSRNFNWSRRQLMSLDCAISCPSPSLTTCSFLPQHHFCSSPRSVLNSFTGENMILLLSL